MTKYLQSIKFFIFLLVQLQIYTLLYDENYTLTYNT